MGCRLRCVVQEVYVVDRGVLTESVLTNDVTWLKEVFSVGCGYSACRWLSLSLRSASDCGYFI